MIELRWLDRKVMDLHPMINVVNGHPREKVLQYRLMMPSVDASGALCPGQGWSAWQDVPAVREG